MNKKHLPRVDGANPSFKRVVSCCTLAVLLLACGTAAAAISTGERTALLDLYASTNGANWVNNVGWGGGVGTECAWYGVTCAADNNSVVQLKLADNNLSGPLPSNLQDLSHLTLLFLGNNAITGSLPSLVDMQVMETFAVGSNLLTGSIPPIESLSALGSFDVGNNDLDGSFPEISGLNSLYLFDLSDNRIAGSIPSLANLPSLTSFNVSDNQLGGTIPSLAALNQLQSFYVAGNQLSGAVPAPPDPSVLANNESSLCPNLLTPSTSVQWDAATGSTPWFLECPNDIIFRDGFDPGI